jgi:hypothetical protein
VDLRQRLLEPLQRCGDQLAGLLTVVGVEDRADQRGQDRLLLAPGMPECFAEDVDGASAATGRRALGRSPFSGRRARR